MRELESEAHPALDALTVKVTSAALERVKRVKGRMTRVTARVAAVRDEIQRFLDDDSDSALAAANPAICENPPPIIVLTLFCLGLFGSLQ